MHYMRSDMDVPDVFNDQRVNSSFFQLFKLRREVFILDFATMKHMAHIPRTGYNEAMMRGHTTRYHCPSGNHPERINWQYCPRYLRQSDRNKEGGKGASESGGDGEGSVGIGPHRPGVERTELQNWH